jgi:hypothetical protein
VQNETLHSPLDHLYIERLVFILGIAWFGLLAWNQLVWAFVTLAIFTLATGFVVSRFVLGIHGWATLTLSSASSGSVQRAAAYASSSRHSLMNSIQGSV